MWQPVFFVFPNIFNLVQRLKSLFSMFSLFSQYSVTLVQGFKSLFSMFSLFSLFSKYSVIQVRGFKSLFSTFSLFSQFLSHQYRGSSPCFLGFLCFPLYSITIGIQAQAQGSTLIKASFICQGMKRETTSMKHQGGFQYEGI